jgi:hypothetical protein
MMSPGPLRLLGSGLLLLAAASLVQASGSYPPNPPRLGGVALAQIDASAYNLGKSLFLGRLSLPAASSAAGDPSASRERLTAAQSRLPERVRAEVDLPALAGRLDAAQVDALLYYVGIRFRIEIPAASA